jgi:hypothetical protein
MGWNGMVEHGRHTSTARGSARVRATRRDRCCYSPTRAIVPRLEKKEARRRVDAVASSGSLIGSGGVTRPDSLNGGSSHHANGCPSARGRRPEGGRVRGAWIDLGGVALRNTPRSTSLATTAWEHFHRCKRRKSRRRCWRSFAPCRLHRGSLEPASRFVRVGTEGRCRVRASTPEPFPGARRTVSRRHAPDSSITKLPAGRRVVRVPHIHRSGVSTTFVRFLFARTPLVDSAANTTRTGIGVALPCRWRRETTT